MTSLFYKMTGSGNDFVLVDGRTAPVSTWSPEAIRSICARRTGVGADGFVVLEPGSGPDAVRFHFFNNDGGRTEMCGNASLCSTRMAVRVGLVEGPGLTLETDAGAIPTRVLEGPGERAELFLPDVPALERLDELRGDEAESVFAGRVGVPHLVVVVGNVDAVDLANRGRELRNHPRLAPAGANVNFVSPDPSVGWAMRTYERGVEAETLACGTGAVAASAALMSIHRAEAPIHLKTASGCVLTVSGVPTAQGGLTNASLEGEGRLVFSGYLRGAGDAGET